MPENPAGQLPEGEDPKSVVRNGQEVLSGIGAWSGQPIQQQRKIRAYSIVGLLGLVGWLFQNFLQLRGVVDVVASRIDLGVMWFAGMAIVAILTVGTKWRSLRGVVFGVFLAIALIGLDSWAPKSKQQMATAMVPAIAQRQASQPEKRAAAPTYNRTRLAKRVTTTPTVAPSQSPAPQIGIEVQLVERSVKAVENCHALQKDYFRRRDELVRRVKELSPPENLPQARGPDFGQQVMVLNREIMTLYQQVYRQEFMEVRRLVVPEVPAATEIVIDYENPQNMGGVTEICFDLSKVTNAYIGRQLASKKIRPEDAQAYMERIVPR
jgi:hypothetical protein